MKKIQIKIDEQGNYSLDMGEGFSGMSCTEKAQQLQIILGGEEKDSQTKPEYYDSNDNLMNDLFNS
jgi:hypothetical protein